MRALRFSLVLALTPAAFGQSFVNGSGQLPTTPGANNSTTENVDWADVDLDGDFDALFADGGSFGKDQNRLWINQGGTQGGTSGFFADLTASQLPAILDESRDIDFADIDADGDPDAVVSNTNNSPNQANQVNQILINQGGLQGGTAGFFASGTATHWVNLGVNNGVTFFSSIPPALVLPSGGFIDNSGDTVLGDLDADGDMDILHSAYGDNFSGDVPHRIFLNDGLGFFEEFNPSGIQLTIGAITNGVPALWAAGVQQHETTNTNGQEADIATTAIADDLGDLDGDFDLDLVLNDRDDHPRLFRNELAGGVLLPFVDITAAAFSQPVSGGGNYEQELGDVDNDDDLDLYGVNWGSSGFNDSLMLNNGAFGFGPHISIPSSSSDDEEADFFDYDADGDLDVYVANFSGEDKLYANQGAPGYALAATSGVLPTGVVNKVALGVDSVDVELDGDLDVMVAHSQNQADVLLLNVTGTADTHAPRVVAESVSAPGCAGSIAVRAQVYDNASWEWQRYNTTELVFTVDSGPEVTLPMRYSGGQLWLGTIPAGVTGAIDYHVRSTDLQGNVGVSETHSYVTGVASYCTAGTSANGCQALLSASGTPSASAASGFVVHAGGLAPNVSGAFFWGTNGPQANPWGNGTSWMCVVPPVFRGATQVASAGSPCGATLDYDLTIQWQAKPASNPGAGTVTQVQLWYRDPLNTSNQKTSLSDALQFTACP